ncbi:spore coat protein [Domibacillus iocasae]|uniref:Spore gernimation protein GerQ n=1 Tax=Domibacillus iocasae TaxID=1714016 RepID=A0A1E7DK44_9BACI|nr:spore coat protein [Domibacillus iocasae]OES43452.1 spore gernimation protein GerQ [Domibacillus iocasae]
MAQKNKNEAVLDDLAIATDFLITAKAGVRNLAVAITETATPEVKKILRRELDNAIDTHDKIAQYMIENEMYHAYDLDEQVTHDLEKADKALAIAPSASSSTGKRKSNNKKKNGS